MNTTDSKRVSLPRWLYRVLMLILALLIAAVAVGLYLVGRFSVDNPVSYPDNERHFMYGSTGGERESGFPFWIWQALPQVCAEHLPGRGYASLGMLYEEGRDLPIGMSQRRHLGIDRVFLNCAACHTGTVRSAADASPRIYTGMPAHQLDLQGFQEFFFRCASDEKFRTDFIVPEIVRLGADPSLIDRLIVYPVAIALMRERLLMLKTRFSFTDKQPRWGPGRVDTFNAAKVLFNIPVSRLPAEELRGTSDFPSIWLQGPKKIRDDGQPMQLHWDGNNTATEERNKSAAFGTGTTPPTLDTAAIGRIEEWLLALAPPAYPFPVDEALAEQGAPIYAEYCAGCHGANGRDFAGARVGHVTPVAEIGTDRGRLDSYTRDLAVNQGTLYAGYPWRFTRFRKTHGYANMPLDGLWLRAPYLHNGSVPTLADLLEPAAKRPQRFYRGYDVYDPQRVGFVTDVATEGGRRYFEYDTSLPGNANHGHEGRAYGTELAPEDKTALVEFLKTF